MADMNNIPTWDKFVIPVETVWDCYTYSEFDKMGESVYRWSADAEVVIGYIRCETNLYGAWFKTKIECIKHLDKFMEQNGWKFELN